MDLSCLGLTLECAEGAPWSSLQAFWAQPFSLVRG